MLNGARYRPRHQCIGPRVAIGDLVDRQARSGQTGRAAGTAPGDQPDLGGELIRSRTGIDHTLVDSQIAGGIGSQLWQLIPTHLGSAGHDEREPAGVVDRLERSVARAAVERRIATHATEHTPARLVHSALVSEQHDLGTHPGITESWAYPPASQMSDGMRASASTTLSAVTGSGK